MGVVPTLGWAILAAFSVAGAQGCGLAELGITALISQGWGMGTVGHSATVTWQRHLPFCHLEDMGKQTQSPTFSQEGVLYG